MKNAKKIGSLLLAAAMCTGTAAPAFAEQMNPLLEEAYGFREMGNQVKENGGRIDMDMQLSIPNGAPLTYQYNAGIDRVQKKFLYMVDMKSADEQLSFYMDPEKAQVFSTLLSENIYELDYGKDLAAHLMSSPLLTSMNISLSAEEAEKMADAVKDLMNMLFECLQSPNKDAAKQKKSAKDLIIEINQANDLVKVNELEDKEFVINGEKKVCKGYSFSLDPENTAQILTLFAAKGIDDTAVKNIKRIVQDGYQIADQVAKDEMAGLPKLADANMLIGIIQSQAQEIDTVEDLISGENYGSLICSNVQNALEQVMEQADVETYLTEDGKMVSVDIQADLIGKTSYSVKPEADSDEDTAASSNTEKYQEKIDVDVNVELLGDKTDISASLASENLNLNYRETSKTEDTSVISDISLEMDGGNEAEQAALNLRETLNTSNNELRMDGNLKVNNETAPITMKGKIEQEQKGGYMKIVIDEFRMTAPDKEDGSLILTGELGFGPLNEELKPLEGNIVELFTAELDQLFPTIAETESEAAESEAATEEAVQ